ncbi:hypothetical protein SAMN05877962_1322 [Alloalcanivorax xenomutans]|uniref:hypothetical protein n=1 Tax=Alloalcanivorax xenomutans TaxID=1094342 RepID=UPI000BCE6FF7|nr:hypothetical protein [Alloalcanivorax xenomutans]SOC28046.1 hypothetical protein SAMN05877962_1322 [Alloalcanivorax xenomutans]
MKAKIIMLSALGVASFGLTQAANASWDSGACPQPHTGPAPCVERNINGTWEHFNGDGSHADEWHGPIEFVGTSTLGCSIATAECTLSLTGNVKKFQDGSGNWHIGIQVVDGDVTGSGLCPGINLSGFPWYAGPTTMHTGFSSSTGIPYPGPYVGNMGNINLTALGGLITVNNSHVHDVTFDNNGSGASYFDFDSPLYTGGNSDNDSGCDVDGRLFVNTYDDINIY